MNCRLVLSQRSQFFHSRRECQKGRNRRIDRKRAKVEHVFAGLRHLGSQFLRTIWQARAKAQGRLQPAKVCHRGRTAPRARGSGPRGMRHCAS